MKHLTLITIVILISCSTVFEAIASDKRPQVHKKKTQYLGSFLEKQLAASKNCVYRVPSEAELTQFRSAFEDLIAIIHKKRWEELDKVEKKLNSIDLQITRVQTRSNKPYISIHEASSSLRGWGVYFISDSFSETRPVIIQTPHARSDIYSSTIGSKLTDAVLPSAFFSSTVQRNVQSDPSMPDMENPEGQADQAHASQTIFQAATESLSTLHPDLLVIQIHGFKDRPPESPGYGIDLIASPASRSLRHRQYWNESIQIFRTALHPWKVAEFGADVLELGAFTNIQAKCINEQSSGVFMHIELSYSFRDSFIKTKKTRNAFCEAMQQVIKRYEIEL